MFGELTVSSSTTFQGLLIFSRHDVTLLAAIKKTGVFDTMFSDPAREAGYLILENVEQIVALQNTYVPDKLLTSSEQSSYHRIIKSLDTAIEWNSSAYPGEAFLTTIALAIKIFLETVLRCTTEQEENSKHTAVQLMECLEQPEQQLCPSLALCSSLESVFWQTMMGAIAAADAHVKSFYISRVKRISITLALTSWDDALVILQKFFWIPSIFSEPCYQVLSEILDSQGCTDK